MREEKSSRAAAALAPDPDPSSRVVIPRTIEDIDARWLTEALSVRNPGLQVESAKVLQSLGGACTKLRVELRTNQPAFPDRVIVKGCFEPHSQTMIPTQLREVNAYRRLVPLLREIETVRCFFVGGDETRGSALILEDLDVRGARCLRATEPVADFALAARFVDLIARLHAHWWDSPDLADDRLFGWSPDLSDAKLMAHGEIRLADPAIRAEILSSPRAAAVPTLLHDHARLKRASDALKVMRHSMPTVLAHGDTHLSNLFVTADSQPGFLDWTCRRAPWILDLAYFVAGCLDVMDRRRWEAALVQHYLERLAGYGVDAPGFDEAWFAYRCWHVYGLMVWLPNTTNYHTETNITAMATRYASAIVDHDTLRLLGV